MKRPLSPLALVCVVAGLLCPASLAQENQTTVNATTNTEPTLPPLPPAHLSSLVISPKDLCSAVPPLAENVTFINVYCNRSAVKAELSLASDDGQVVDVVSRELLSDRTVLFDSDGGSVPTHVDVCKEPETSRGCRTYFILVTRQGPEEAFLESLSLSPAAFDLSPPFSPMRLEYNVTLFFDRPTVVLATGLQHAWVSLTSFATADQLTIAKEFRPNKTGLIDVFVKSRGPNPATTVYTINYVTVPPTYAVLDETKGLQVSAGDLLPPFNPYTTFYFLRLPRGESSVTLSIAPSKEGEGEAQEWSVNGGSPRKGEGTESVHVGATGMQEVLVTVKGEKDERTYVILASAGEAAEGLNEDLLLRNISVWAPGSIPIETNEEFHPYRESPWWACSEVVNTVGQVAKWFNLALAALNIENFLDTARFMQYLSILSDIRGLPDMFEEFAANFEDISFQFSFVTDWLKAEAREGGEDAQKGGATVPAPPPPPPTSAEGDESLAAALTQVPSPPSVYAPLAAELGEKGTLRETAARRRQLEGQDGDSAPAVQKKTADSSQVAVILEDENSSNSTGHQVRPQRIAQKAAGFAEDEDTYERSGTAALGSPESADEYNSASGFSPHTLHRGDPDEEAARNATLSSHFGPIKKGHTSLAPYLEASKEMQEAHEGASWPATSSYSDAAPEGNPSKQGTEQEQTEEYFAMLSKLVVFSLLLLILVCLYYGVIYGSIFGTRIFVYAFKPGRFWVAVLDFGLIAFSEAAALLVFQNRDVAISGLRISGRFVQPITALLLALYPCGFLLFTSYMLWRERGSIVWESYIAKYLDKTVDYGKAYRPHWLSSLTLGMFSSLFRQEITTVVPLKPSAATSEQAFLEEEMKNFDGYWKTSDEYHHWQSERKRNPRDVHKRFIELRRQCRLRFLEKRREQWKLENAELLLDKLEFKETDVLAEAKGDIKAAAPWTAKAFDTELERLKVALNKDAYFQRRHRNAEEQAKENAKAALRQQTRILGEGQEEGKGGDAAVLFGRTRTARDGNAQNVPPSSVLMSEADLEMLSGEEADIVGDHELVSHMKGDPLPIPDLPKGLEGKSLREVNNRTLQVELDLSIEISHIEQLMTKYRDIEVEVPLEHLQQKSNDNWGSLYASCTRGQRPFFILRRLNQLVSIFALAALADVERGGIWQLSIFIGVYFATFLAELVSAFFGVSEAFLIEEKKQVVVPPQLWDLILLSNLNKMRLVVQGGDFVDLTDEEKELASDPERPAKERRLMNYGRVLVSFQTLLADSRQEIILHRNDLPGPLHVIDSEEFDDVPGTLLNALPQARRRENTQQQPAVQIPQQPVNANNEQPEEITGDTEVNLDSLIRMQSVIDRKNQLSPLDPQRISLWLYLKGLEIAEWDVWRNEQLIFARRWLGGEVASMMFQTLVIVCLLFGHSSMTDSPEFAALWSIIFTLVVLGEEVKAEILGVLDTVQHYSFQLRRYYCSLTFCRRRIYRDPKTGTSRLVSGLKFRNALMDLETSYEDGEDELKIQQFHLARVLWRLEPHDEPALTFKDRTVDDVNVVFEGMYCSGEVSWHPFTMRKLGMMVPEERNRHRIYKSLSVDDSFGRSQRSHIEQQLPLALPYQVVNHHKQAEAELFDEQQDSFLSLFTDEKFVPSAGRAVALFGDSVPAAKMWRIQHESLVAGHWYELVVKTKTGENFSQVRQAVRVDDVQQQTAVLERIVARRAKRKKLLSKVVSKFKDKAQKKTEDEDLDLTGFHLTSGEETLESGAFAETAGVGGLPSKGKKTKGGVSSSRREELKAQAKMLKDISLKTGPEVTFYFPHCCEPQHFEWSDGQSCPVPEFDPVVLLFPHKAPPDDLIDTQNLAGGTDTDSVFTSSHQDRHQRRHASSAASRAMSRAGSRFSRSESSWSVSHDGDSVRGGSSSRHSERDFSMSGRNSDRGSTRGGGDGGDVRRSSARRRREGTQRMSVCLPMGGDETANVMNLQDQYASSNPQASASREGATSALGYSSLFQLRSGSFGGAASSLAVNETLDHSHLAIPLGRSLGRSAIAKGAMPIPFSHVLVTDMNYFYLHPTKDVVSSSSTSLPLARFVASIVWDLGETILGFFGSSREKRLVTEDWVPCRLLYADGERSETFRVVPDFARFVADLNEEMELDRIWDTHLFELFAEAKCNRLRQVQDNFQKTRESETRRKQAQATGLSSMAMVDMSMRDIAAFSFYKKHFGKVEEMQRRIDFFRVVEELLTALRVLAESGEDETEEAGEGESKESAPMTIDGFTVDKVDCVERVKSALTRVICLPYAWDDFSVLDTKEAVRDWMQK
uniref:Cadherin-like beta sandwich domain-containing protein n=1 Tax=Chromera velia CCMP2878 TaxID=1169474 RepID=A0A0G4FR21_9ALVE|eukprot:Cvel_3640.t1-p1 / transcript=Cvel_3640.t1 / gene=Cvel_3640 / organism=Chromera_velia_CCMP2878 / gene_product=hypothetical protein / transcript_product=hypothetical protein / location=Cvel_scaffold150:19003-45680(+) / protein_length=2307 / sequence_SO=supercontig / SO=protein_coding / is_pseudo=false